MAEFVQQFNDACSRVEPTSDDKGNAAAAHKAVRECLEADATLVSYGIDTILIGSYKRQVSIRRVKDVDVFSKLPDVDTGLSSSELLDLFEQALSGYGDRLDRQDRSICVSFEDEYGLHVDAVPARPAGDLWEIPERPATGPWQVTNPEGLGDASTAMNERFGGNYVPVVKLIRQTRRAHLGKRPGGLFFEILTYHAFDNMAESMEDGNKHQLYVAALQSIAAQLEDFRLGGDVADPSMPDAVLTIRVDQTQKDAAATTFASLAARAKNALDDDLQSGCPSAKEFQDILGKNDDDEWVFELPSYCDANGAPLPAKASDRSIPPGTGRYA